MRKRFFACMLALAVTVCMTGCGKTGEGESTVPSGQQQESVSAENSSEESASQEKPAVTQGSVSESLRADFQKLVSEHEGASAEEIAAMLCENEALSIGAVPMPVEPGFLNGFNNTEITDFSDGAMFAPMIGAIPFIGYVFVPKDGVDVNAFMKQLQDNGDLRWNICTEADEMVVDRAGDMVLFVMSPIAFEE